MGETGFDELLETAEPAPQRLRVAIDEENNGEEWWSAALAAADAGAVPYLPVRLETGESMHLGAWLVDPRPTVVFVGGFDRERFLAWATSLPGWEGGPEYAPHPLVVEELKS